MFSLSSKTASNDGNEAASLSMIKVRKAPDSIESVAKPPKSGDITSRLAEFSRQIDENTSVDSPPPFTGIPEVAPPKGYPRTRTEDVNRTHDAAPRPTRQPQSRGWGKKERADDLLSYWASLRHGQKYPARNRLSTEKIGLSWPNCVLVNCDQRSGGRMQIDYGFTQALRNAQSDNSEDVSSQTKIDISPMIIDWVFSQCRDVAITRKPCHTTENFPSSTGESNIRLISLPLSDDQQHIDYVLCHLQEV